VALAHDLDVKRADLRPLGVLTDPSVGDLRGVVARLGGVLSPFILSFFFTGEKNVSFFVD